MSSLPRAMRAVIAERPGGAEVLRIVERPVPMPGPDEVLIEVAAAGINRPDIMQREGTYPPPPGASDVLGLEVAGRCVAVGERVSRVHPEDRVCALVAAGGYAEYCVAPASLCFAIPITLSVQAAAAVPEACFTVWNNLAMRGRLSAGEILLIHGGASGIGTTAIQIAREMGARVIATAGSSAKCAACSALGAQQVIDYRQQDFVEEVLEFTSGAGVDVIMDMVGGEYFARNLRCLAPEGRLVQIAVQAGAEAKLNLFDMMQRRISISGSTLRPRTVLEKTQIAIELERTVWPWLEAGQLVPQIYANFPLGRVAEAHTLLEGGEHIGKLVLDVHVSN